MGLWLHTTRMEESPAINEVIPPYASIVANQATMVAIVGNVRTTTARGLTRQVLRMMMRTRPSWPPMVMH
jgi:hypothetical protein